MLLPKLILTADWHFGHDRVPTKDTIHDIRTYLIPQLTHEIDILTVAGDIFDGSLSLNSDDIGLIMDLLVDLMLGCFQYNIKLRILRGTYTHDRKQQQRISELRRNIGIPISCKVINNLFVEKIEDLNTSILYIPDDLPYNNKADIFSDIAKLLTVNNLKQVDYVVMHGEFEHINVGPDRHNAFRYEDFKSICRYSVLSGHIHRPSRYKNIVYAGSFNRLAHNEEEAKGFWIIEGAQATFITNKEATHFVTLDYRRETDFNLILEKYIERLDQFDPERKSFVRIYITDTNIRQALARYHDTHYPNIRLTFDSKLKHNSNANYLTERIKTKQLEELKAPSYKNIATIVCNHMLERGITINLNIVEEILNEK